MRKRKTAPRKRASRQPDLLRVPPEWAWHYRTLVALRDHLVGEQLAQATAAPVGGAPDNDRFDRDFIRALLAAEPDALGEISAAIARILFGHYGLCEATGRKIPAARLRATPWIRCLARAGTAGGRPRR